MTLHFDFTLGNDGTLVSHGQKINKTYMCVSEFPILTLLMEMIIGLLGVAIFIRKPKEN
jgi:hypothetical protein